jgi:hypothetical protein
MIAAMVMCNSMISDNLGTFDQHGFDLGQ